MLIFLAGILLGAVAVWLTLYRQAHEAENRASASEAAANEIRQQMQRWEAQNRQLQLDLTGQQAGRVAAETRLEELRTNLEEQKKTMAEATQRLTDTFNALSAEALKSNNQAFLDLARKAFEGLVQESKGDLKVSQEAVSGLVKPLQESLKNYETHIHEMESKQAQAYGGLLEQLAEMKKTHEVLQRETSNLSNALRTPRGSGSWGEITLRRVVEVAGMSQYCDFEEQVSMPAEEGRLRPDLIVRIPGGKTVAIDAKAPVEAYRTALEAKDEQERTAAFVQYGKAVREHLRKLSSKEYWKYLTPSPDFVVLFLPGESFFSAALEQERELIEDGIRNRVVLATPSTLITLLRTVAYAWQQQDVTENARLIWEAGQDLYERVAKFAEHLNGIRKGLEEAGKKYNQAVASWEKRLVPGARKLKDLGAASGHKDIPEVEPADALPERLPETDAE